MTNAERIAAALAKKPGLLERVLTSVLLGDSAVATPWETWDHTSRTSGRHQSWTRRVLFFDGRLVSNPDYDADICRVIQEEDSESQNFLSNQYHATLERNGGTIEDLGWVDTPGEGIQRIDTRLREVGWLLLGSEAP